MISIYAEGGVYLKGQFKTLKTNFSAHFKRTVGETTQEMNTRMSPLGKFFTRHIKNNLKEGNSQPIGTGRIMTAKNLVVLDKASTLEGEGITSFSFKYTFPTNSNVPRGGEVEYGYPLGNKATRLGGWGYDNMVRWLMSKNSYYGGIFKYTNRHGTQIEITKPYQAKSVVFAMIRGQKRFRKGNVPNWYYIKTEHSDVSRELDKWTKNWYEAFVKNFNK